MFKLNFEKALIFVLILILFISTANIFSQYISMYFGHKKHNEIDVGMTKNIGFPASLLKADQLFKQGLYDEAQREYLKITNMPNLSTKQKAAVHFSLGICNFRLKKYDLARDSFLRSGEYNNNDPVAYNNAAACSYYLKDLERAEELQKLAVSSLPVIEYHYNLARIYEEWGRYRDSAKYYLTVAGAEENITKEDRIDPVRIKNKVMRLLTNFGSIGDISNEPVIALRLKDSREVFIIDDVNMDIKDKNFKWSIVKENGSNRLYCSYDREKSDPYGLIDSLKWTVKRGGRTVFTSKRDKFSLSVTEGGSYIVYLDINYDTNKSSSSFVDVTRSSGMYSSSSNQIKNPSNAKCKYYEYAVYEQVFEKDFRIKTSGHIDRFNTEWGKDNVEAKIMDKDFIDAQSAIYIKNTSDKDAGLWADLSELIDDKQLKGRTISMKFYARKVTSNAKMIVNIRTKAGKVYKTIPRNYELEYKWKRFGVDVLIPENADGLTISFATQAGEEIKIDGFIITIVR